MKKIIFFSACLALILSACSKKEGTLLDFQPVYYNADSLLSVSIAGAGKWHMVTPEKLVAFNGGTWYEFDLAARTLQTSPCLPELNIWNVEYKSKELDTLVYLDRFSGECSMIINKGSTKIKSVSLPPSNVYFDNIGNVPVHRIRGVHFFNASDAIIMADYDDLNTGIYTYIGMHVYKLKNFEDVDTLAYVRQQFDGDFTNCEGLDLKMVNKNLGYMLVRDRFDGVFDYGNGQVERRIMVTYDGGLSWYFLGPEFRPGTYGDQHMDWLMVTPGENLLSGSYIGGYTISNDGGHNWPSVKGYSGAMFYKPQILPDGTLVGTTLVDQMDGFYMYPTELLASNDDGITWEKSGPKFYGESMDCYDANNWVAGSGSLIQITRDGGKTWELVSAPLHY